MERITDKRMRTYDNKKVAQYLLRWKEYGPKWNEWRSITKLGNCMDLVEDYENKLVVTGTSNRASNSKPTGGAIRTPRKGISTQTLTKPMVVIPPRTEVPAASPGIPSTTTSITSTPATTSVVSGLRRSNRLRH